MRRAPFAHIFVLISFLINTFGPMPAAYADDFFLPKPGVMISLSPPFNPPVLKGLKVHPDNPFRFDFILDQGDDRVIASPEVQGVIASERSERSNLSKTKKIASSPSAPRNDTELKAEAQRLIKYFLAAITVPEKDLWVNLSPYEKDRIIPDALGKTEMGRDLLAEDYMLKQITASLIYPEDEIGKKFWKRVYEEAAKQFGTTNIPVNTFNKVWIVPEKAVVYENAKAGTAYVVESKLKVMLEQDYLALSHGVIASERGERSNLLNSKKIASGHTAPRNDTSALGSQIVREIVLPKLEQEINEGKNFAQLRQVYNSLILATWYKKKIKDSILAQVYADKNKVAGVSYDHSIILTPRPNSVILSPEGAKDPDVNNKPLGPSVAPLPQDDDVNMIYNQYLQAFKKGVYNYIKEEQDSEDQQAVPRKYFSGGVQFDFAMNASSVIHYTNIIPNDLKNAMQITADMAMKSNDGSSLKPRTFMDYITASLGKPLAQINEMEMFMMWSLYSNELDRSVLQAQDPHKAYAVLYNVYSQYLTEDPTKGSTVRAYLPVVRKPFLSVEEVKEMVDVDTEWSIDFLPDPSDWKGASRSSFILCVMGDHQLHMSFYDQDGLIREFKTDKEIEQALRNIGLIGVPGKVVLVRSSLDERFKNQAAPGIGVRISLGGHSHPKGAGVLPSQSGRIDEPADLEVLRLRLAGMPASFPINSDLPPMAQRARKVIVDQGPSIEGQDKDVVNALDLYTERLEALIQAQPDLKDSLFAEEVILYFKVLQTMHQHTIGQYQGQGNDDEYVHRHRAEFAGELAFHPRFQEGAKILLEESVAGALRIKARQRPGNLWVVSSLHTMMDVVDQIIHEASQHPDLRGMAVQIVNDPGTYGLDEKDFPRPSKPRQLINAIVRRVTSPFRTKADLKPSDFALKVTSSDAHPERLASTFADVSRGLVKAVNKERNSSQGKTLRLDQMEVVMERTKRLLILANNSIDDDPQLAETALKEFHRLLTVFPNNDFQVAARLGGYPRIMTSKVLRQVLMSIAESVPNKMDRYQVFADIAFQVMTEGDARQALDLLGKIKRVTFNTFSMTLERLMDLLFVSQGGDQRMIGQLINIIENTAFSGKVIDEQKTKLLVKLGDKFESLGMGPKAVEFYGKAWNESVRTKQPLVTRLRYLVPIMRVKGMSFPMSRNEILIQIKALGENELLGEAHKTNVLVLLAREHALNRDYDEAEKIAGFINQNMEFPADHYAAIYGEIMEAAALNGDNDRIFSAASKIPNNVEMYWQRVAQLLINHGQYRRVMDLGRVAVMEVGLNTNSIGFWGLTQLEIAKRILKKDSHQTEIARELLIRAVSQGIYDHDLKDALDLIAQHPSIDPDGRFVLNVLNTAYKKNKASYQYQTCRVILRCLRQIIQERVKGMDLNLTAVFAAVNRALPPAEGAASLVADYGGKAVPHDKTMTVDRAIRGADNTGGIDLTSDKVLQVKIGSPTEAFGDDKGEIQFKIDPAMLEQLRNAPGFVPVIINIQPMTDLKLFLGITESSGNSPGTV